MAEEIKKESALGKALEADGYTGVSKYFKAFGMGVNGTTEKYMENNRKRKKEKIDEVNKKAKEIKDADEEKYTKTNAIFDEIAKHKEEGISKKIDIMSSPKFVTPEERASAFNSYQNTYKQKLEMLTVRASQQMEGVQSGSVLTNLGDTANAVLSNAAPMSNYQKLTIGDKSIFVDDKSYEAAMENPNQYGIGKDGNLYALDQDGKITNQKVAEGKNFDGLPNEDKDSLVKTWDSEKDAWVYTKKELGATVYDKPASSTNSVSGYDVIPPEELNPSVRKHLENKGVNTSGVTVKTQQDILSILSKNIKQTDKDKQVNLVITATNMLSEIYTGEKTDITKKDIAKLKQAEVLAKIEGLSTTVKNQLIDSEATLNAGSRLIEKLDKIKPEKINRGMYDKFVQLATELQSDDSWESMGEEEKKKALLTISTNTSIGNALAQYIKSISGSAVAQAEYDRLRKVFTTGDFSNIQSVKEAISTFYSDIASSHYSKLEDNLLEGGSFVANKMMTHNERFSGLIKTEKKTVEKTVDEQGNTKDKAMKRDKARALLIKQHPKPEDQSEKQYNAKIEAYLTAKGY